MRNFAILHIFNYISSKRNITCCKISKTNSIIFHNNFSFRFDHVSPPRPEGELHAAMSEASLIVACSSPSGRGGKNVKTVSQTAISFSKALWPNAPSTPLSNLRYEARQRHYQTQTVFYTTIYPPQYKYLFFRFQTRPNTHHALFQISKRLPNRLFLSLLPAMY